MAERARCRKSSHRFSLSSSPVHHTQLKCLLLPMGRPKTATGVVPPSCATTPLESPPGHPSAPATAHNRNTFHLETLGDTYQYLNTDESEDTLSPLPPIPHLAPLPNFAASAVHLGGVPFPNNDSPQRTLSLPPPPRAGVRTGSTFGRTISNAEPPERILDMGAWSPIGNGDTLGTGTFGTERQPGFTVSTERQSDLDFTQRMRTRTRTRTRTMHGPSPSVERYIPPFDDLFERTFDLAPPFEIAHIRDSMVAKDRAEAAAPYYHQNASTFSISM